MRGDRPTIADIELQLEEFVLPVNLLANESLSPADEPEEEQDHPYRIDTTCGTCGTGVRLIVVATLVGISRLQHLLISDLSIICSHCSRDRLHHGRS